MAEKKQDNKEKQDKKKPESVLAKAEKKAAYQQEDKGEFLIRILGYDIPGSKNLITGLTRIKGISWSISNAACIKLNMPKSKKISDLSKPEIQEIEKFFHNLNVADFLRIGALMLKRERQNIILALTLI